MNKQTYNEFLKLLRVYRKARQQIVLSLLDYSPGKTREAELLSEINKIIKNLEEQASKFVETSFTREYKDSIRTAEETLKKQGIKGLGFGLSNIDKDSIDLLVNETRERLIIAAKGIQREVITQIRAVKEAQIREKLGVTLTTGQSTDKIIKDIANDFKKEGIEAFVAKDGRKLKLENYTKVVIRNNIQQAQNQASYNRYVQSGVRVVQYSIISDEKVSDLCSVREGNYYYIDTVTPLPWGSHFNCRHTLIPVIKVPEGVKIYSGYQNS